MIASRFAVFQMAPIIVLWGVFCTQHRRWVQHRPRIHNTIIVAYYIVAYYIIAYYIAARNSLRSGLGQLILL